MTNRSLNYKFFSLLIGILFGFWIWDFGFPSSAEAVEHKWEVGQGTGLTTAEFVVKDARTGVGAIRLAIDAGGNVGIGTTEPGATLEVAGQVKITGGSPGVNKELTSDSAGLATWQTEAGGMEIVLDSTTTSNSDVFAFPGLSGDTDEEYLIVARIISAATSPEYRLRFEADSGNNYGHQRMFCESTSIYAGRNTSDNGIYLAFNGASGQIAHIKITVYAKSGYNRTIISEALCASSGTTASRSEYVTGIWNNSSTNISAISINSSAPNGIGAGSHFVLYKKRK
jgi:hypothetical protein